MATRHLVGLVLAALLAVVLPASPASADPPLNNGGGWTSYPNPDANKRNLGEIPASHSFTSLDNIAAAFNNARSVENGDICPGGSCEPNGRVMPLNFSFPGNYASLSNSEKVLHILNAERTARGLLPFEGVNAAVESVAQDWAQRIATTNNFAHNPNALGDIAAECGTACAGHIGRAATENLYGSFGLSYELENAMYGWLYVDRNLGGSWPDQQWGHRHALLWDWLVNDHGPTGSEGFIGVGLATNASGWTYVVWNAIDTSAAWPVVLPPLDAVEGGFIPVTPCAVFDTRLGSAFNGRATGGSTLTAQITGSIPATQTKASCALNGIVPANATAVMVNVVAVSPVVSGNLRISASDYEASGGVVNFGPGRNGTGTNSNAVPVALPPGGSVDVFVNSSLGVSATHVRLVVLGYYVDPSTSGALGFVPVTPCAIFDTRHGTDYGSPATGQMTLRAQVSGAVGTNQTNESCAASSAIPAGATAAMVNVVAVGPTESGNLRISAAGVPANGGIVNFGPGWAGPGTNANAVPVALSNDGKVDLFVNAAAGLEATHVRLVVLGYYVPRSAAASGLTPVTPCAVLDTRSSSSFTYGIGQATITPQITGALSSAQTTEPCALAGIVPANSTGVLVNVAAISPSRGGNLRVSAAGTTASGGIVNFGLGHRGPGSNSNAVPVALSGDGRLSVFTNSAAGTAATHVRLVILGYYT